MTPAPRLTAILVADAGGDSRLVAADALLAMPKGPATQDVGRRARLGPYL